MTTAVLATVRCCDCRAEVLVSPEDDGPDPTVRCGRCAGTAVAVILSRREGEAIDAGDLLAMERCSARCLLAMETPPGPGPWCSCRCRGRYHAALIDAPVRAFGEVR